jgi:hypothetical protein
MEVRFASFDSLFFVQLTGIYYGVFNYRTKKRKKLNVKI